MSKLQTICDLEGYGNTYEMLEAATFDGVAAGICRNPGCDYCYEVEPDCRDGYCEECGTQTVASCLVIAGII